MRLLNFVKFLFLFSSLPFLGGAQESHPPLFEDGASSKTISYSDLKTRFNETMEKAAQNANYELWTIQNRMGILKDLAENNKEQCLQGLMDLSTLDNPSSFIEFIKNFKEVNFYFNFYRYPSLTEAIEENAKIDQKLMEIIKISSMDEKIKLSLLMELCGSLYETLLGLGHIEEAKKVALSVYEMIPDAPTAEAFKSHINCVTNLPPDLC